MIDGLVVVMPTLDAASGLGTTLLALGDQATRTVVVDGGSRDATGEIAMAHGAALISAPRGRGPQLAAGARAAAEARWLLFLHADTRLDPGWQASVAAHISAPDAENRAAYFTLAFDDPRPMARLWEWLAAWRCRVLALSYGDQGLLISRVLYDRIGGFAPLPLMEDVDLVRRLGRKRLQALSIRAVTSAARYRRGYLRRGLRNLLCLGLWYLGAKPATVQRLYAG
ncbi:MAG: glycosyltransferase [Alphaproteobacteria bacterium]|nr:glycosyltransferase [Alphaproteobacteria bacterium]